MKQFFLQFIVFSCCILNCDTTTAQNNYIDSLKKVLATEKEDSNKVNTLNKLSSRYYDSNDTINALGFANQALALAQKINFKKGESLAYTNKGKAYENKANYNEAIRNYLLSLSVSESVGANALAAASLSDIGNAYFDLQDSANALKYYNNALSIYKKTGDDLGLADTYLVLGSWYAHSYINNSGEALKCFISSSSFYKQIKDNAGLLKSYLQLASLYRKLHDNADAIKYDYEVLRISEVSGNKKEVAAMFYDIANIYSEQENYGEALKNMMSCLKASEEIKDSLKIGRALMVMGWMDTQINDYTAASAYLDKALNVYNKLGNKAPPIELLATYESIGFLYEKEGIFIGRSDKISASNKYGAANQSYQSALKIAREIKSQYAIAEIYLGLGKLNIYLKQYEKSRTYLTEGLQLTRQFGNSGNIPEAYESLSILDSSQGNFAQAYTDYKLYIQYHDSLVNIGAAKKAAQAAMQYDFDKKEAISRAAQDKKDAEAKSIKRQQYLIIAGLGIVVLAVVVISLIQYRNNKQKQKANQLLRTQKEEIQLQKEIVETTLSELKSTQAQLIQSEKMASLGALTAGIAHEIQNPLNFVNNFSEVNSELISEMREEIANKNYEEVDQIAKDVQDNEAKINHHGKRADAIVKGMLQHSRSSTGVSEPTDINALADEYLRLSYHGLRSKEKQFNATLKTDLDQSIGKIKIIPQDIGRVLLNLYNNAFFAVNEKAKTAGENYQPTVSVQTKKLGSSVVITIADNGNGIPKQIVDQIFQPFFTTKPTGQGTGLGLSLSYDIVKAHGGELTVETKENQGSTFSVRLPVGR